MNDWQTLDEELSAWTSAGRKATFWWRDDDAQQPGEALTQLCDLAKTRDVPLALAVIPDGISDALPAEIQAAPLQVVQHGYAHSDHSAAGSKKCELSMDRGIEKVCEELQRGFRRLEQLFGEQFVPALVPPWNRIDPQVIQALPELGYAGLSTFLARGKATLGIVQVNTHIDVIDWRGSRGFAGENAVLTQAVLHLRARRLAQADADEATGLLTHHLVHDQRTWAFIEEFFQRTKGHGSTQWLDAKTLFQ